MNQKSYAFIPARNGSKRIPQKNFLSFNGQNTLRTVCETALSSGIFAKVIVSTDNPILCSNILKDLAYIEIHNRKLELSTDEIYYTFWKKRPIPIRRIIIEIIDEEIIRITKKDWDKWFPIS